MAAIVLEHGINANLMCRWVSKHERYGKHSLSDDGDAAVVVPKRDVSPANWFPLHRSRHD